MRVMAAPARRQHGSHARRCSAPAGGRRASSARSTCGWNSGDQREAWESRRRRVHERRRASRSRSTIPTRRSWSPMATWSRPMARRAALRQRHHAGRSPSATRRARCTVVGSTMIPDPGDPNSSTSRLRYARARHERRHDRDPAHGSRSPIPLGLGARLDGRTARALWNRVAMGGGELWHTVRTDTGWSDELIASGIYEPNARWPRRR